MRVLLVQPDNKRNILVGSYSVNPLGLEYIAAALTQIGHQVRIVSSIQLSNLIIENEISDFNPNIVGFSVHTFTFDRAIEIAQLIKKISPHTKVVFGGYHPTSCPEIVGNKYIDFVICGEGEDAFKDLINFIEGRTEFDNISGIFYWDNGLKGKRPKKRVDFKSLPIPRRNIKLVERNKVRQIIYPPVSKQRCVAQVTYSRGCPYNCSFCSSQLMFPGGVIWRNPADVVHELQELSSNFGTNLVFFSDLTFNASKSKTHILCDEIIKASLHMNWCALCRIDKMDADLLLHMREAGCVKVSYGIETVRKAMYTNIKDSSQIEKEKFLEIVAMTSKAGLLVRGLFILGFPGEDHESIEELKEFILDSELDDIRMSFFTPFPGTELYSKCKKEDIFISQNFSDFTTDWPIIRLENGLHRELTKIRKNIIRTFYSSKKYKNHFIKNIERSPFLYDSYVEYFRLLKEHELINDEIFYYLAPNEKFKFEDKIEEEIASATQYI